MRRQKNTYRRNIFLISLLLSSVYCNADSSEEAPRIILFLGRFHPLLLHVPIGALIVTFFIDVIGRIQKNYPVNIIKNMLGFCTFFAVLTSILGYFLSLEGGYNERTLDIHFYVGIVTTILIIALYFVSRKVGFESGKVFFPLFVLSLVGISVTGHFGGTLTHGDNFLTEYLRPEPKQKDINVVDSIRMYQDVIGKIFDKKCMECHNATKRKGEFSLSSKQDIVNGGESGLVLLAGSAHESLLFKQLLLPISDDNHMPPAGKEQLTRNEIKLIRKWINDGLDFEGYVKLAQNDSIRPILDDYLVSNTIEIEMASKTNIAKVRKAGFRVVELVPGEAPLNVKLIDENPSRGNINKVSIIKDQVVELDFGKVRVTDDMIQVIKRLKNLKILRVNSSEISDKSIKYIKQLKSLEVLNMYGTNISDEGLEKLLKEIQPKQLYTWKTKVSRDVAQKLSSQFNVNIQNNIQEGFVQKSNLEAPTVSPSKTLFVDSIKVSIESKLKNVEIRYTLNGERPDSTSALFSDNLVIKNSKTLKIATFKKEWLPSETITIGYSKVKHKVPNFSIKDKPDARYPNAGKLFDLEEGSQSFKDGKWNGYLGTDVNTTLDLGEIKTVDNISINCLENVGNWIFFPKQMTVYASIDNKDFEKIGQTNITRKGMGGDPEIKKVTLSVPNTSARFLKVVVENFGKLPKWHPGAGNDSWIFIDEIYLW